MAFKGYMYNVKIVLINYMLFIDLLYENENVIIN